jgi:hypothetical protein
MGATNVWSGTISNGSLSVAASQNVVRISILTIQGSITFLGSGTFNGVAANEATFSVGQGVTLSGSSSQPLDGITITAASGSDAAEVIISYQ